MYNIEYELIKTEYIEYSKKNNLIWGIFKTKNEKNYFWIELNPHSNFKKFYAYKIPLKNYNTFIETQDKKKCYPFEHTIIYEISLKEKNDLFLVEVYDKIKSDEIDFILYESEFKILKQQ